MTYTLKIKIGASLALFLLSIPCMGDPLSLPSKTKISIDHHKTSHQCQLSKDAEQIHCEIKPAKALSSRSLFIRFTEKKPEILELKNGNPTLIGQACYQIKLDKKKLMLNLLSESKCALATARLDKAKFDPKEIANINVQANQEARRRLSIDFAKTKENPIEILAKEKPNIYQICEFVAEQTSVPIGYLLATMDSESRFNLQAKSGPYKGLGQFDKKTWSGTLKNPEFIQIYSQIYPNHLKPERGTSALADVLAIAINAKFAAKKYNKAPGLTPQFILTAVAVHVLGSGGAKSLIAKLDLPNWKTVISPKRLLARYEMSIKLEKDRRLFEARAQNP